jgi:hypothetical protein
MQRNLSFASLPAALLHFYCLLLAAVATATVSAAPLSMAAVQEALVASAAANHQPIAGFRHDDETPQETDSSLSSSLSSQCGIYLAPSTIPGAGLGMFAGNARNKGDMVTAGDLVIPIVEKAWHNGDLDQDLPFLWDEYTWSAFTFPGMLEEGEDVTGASLGIGAAVNCFFPLINTEDSWSALDTAAVHRSQVGAGAFTPYHDRHSTATTDIRAGAELFVDYGNDYFTGREYLYGPIPLLEDYDEADDVLRGFVNVRDSLIVSPVVKQPAAVCDDEEDADAAEQTCTATSHAETFTDSQRVVRDLFALVTEILGDFRARVGRALPDDVTTIDAILHAGGTSMQFYNRSIQSIAWLEEHGQCMDNIRPGNESSSIPQAGRGAFANRFIAAGATVAPAPLIHVADREQLVMYDGIHTGSATGNGDADKADERQRDTSAPMHHQLLLNYCFGHGRSTLLLCPYGALTSLINHSPVPNARIVWSDKATRNKEWFDLPVDDWADKDHAGLAFDYVAIRDIQQDEEVLIDYGNEWQEAWDKHVAEWKPPRNAASYQPAFELDSDLGLVLKTEDEESYEHVDHLTLLCHEAYRVMSGLEANYWNEDKLYTCRVVDRFPSDSGQWLYMAEIYEETDDAEDETCSNILSEVMFAVPRDAFCFEDRYYSRDHAQTWSFRHDMRIPDELMPAAWMNKRL